jgi:hypothetical protein
MLPNRGTCGKAHQTCSGVPVGRADADADADANADADADADT